MSTRKLRPLTDPEITALWSLFGPPPVLGTENQEAYDTLRIEYAAYYRPSNAMQVKLVRELVDMDWEIIRLTRHHTVVIDRYYRRKLENEAFKLRFENQKNKDRVSDATKRHPRELVEIAALQAVVDKTTSDIQEIFKRPPTELDHNLALEQGADFLDALDRWRNAATARRNNVLKLLEYYCGSPNDDGEATAIEYREVQSPELERKPSPPLAPEKVVTDDVAT